MKELLNYFVGIKGRVLLFQVCRNLFFKLSVSTLQGTKYVSAKRTELKKIRLTVLRGIP